MVSSTFQRGKNRGFFLDADLLRPYVKGQMFRIWFQVSERKGNSQSQGKVSQFSLVFEIGSDFGKELFPFLSVMRL